MKSGVKIINPTTIIPSREEIDNLRIGFTIKVRDDVSIKLIYLTELFLFSLS